MLNRCLAALAIACALSTPSLAQSCKASWYGGGEKLNRHTATGEVFRPKALTAAHRSLPFGTKVRVAYRGRSVVVRINDRGPAKYTGRCIDLSRGAAEQLRLKHAGVAHVEFHILK